MLKRLLLAVLAWTCMSSPLMARERYFNYCQKGGQNVVTQGLNSAGEFQRTFQSCTIHVYLTGTTTAATIYSDNLAPTSTALANPFTANSDGFFEFYAAAGRYDVKETFLDTTATPNQTYNVTWGDVYLCDGLGPNADTSCTVGGAAGFHDLLSATHPDTSAFTPPGIGDMIRGSSGNLWEHFAAGSASQVLAIASGTLLPTWKDLSFYQDSTTPFNAASRLGLNLVAGSNVTITPADDAANNRATYTISASSGIAGVNWLANSVAVSTEPGGNLIGGTGITVAGVDNPGSTRADYTISLSSGGNVASINSTGLSADVSTATLYSVPSSGAGMYRISAYIIVTTVASTGAATSTLPAVEITWTDKDNSTSQTMELTATNTANLLTAYREGVMVVDAKASTTIQYATSGYASDTAAQMLYALHIKVEGI